MSGAGWKKRRTLKSPQGEKCNREGQWIRAFKVRSENWIAFENWAHQNKYYMVECKAHRRLYSKGTDPNTYTTFVEIRHDESRVILTAWIEVGFRLRALTLFLLPKILPIDPSGLRGVRKRRQACHELNQLLLAFKQPVIFQSDGLHLADIDSSSFWLLVKMALVVALFTSVLSSRIELSPGLSNFLMNELFKRVMILSSCGLVLFLVHHFAVATRGFALWKKMISSATFGLVFTMAAVFFLTRTRTEDTEAKINYHCLLHFQAQRCSTALQALPEAHRLAMIERLQHFQKELALKK